MPLFLQLFTYCARPHIVAKLGQLLHQPTPALAPAQLQAELRRFFHMDVPLPPAVPEGTGRVVILIGQCALKNGGDNPLPTLQFVDSFRAALRANNVNLVFVNLFPICLGYDSTGRCRNLI